MDLFLAFSYAYSAAAAPYLLAGLLALGIGGGLLLYERFTPASRRFFGVAAALAAWLVVFGWRFLAVDPAVAELWYRLGLALVALQLPVLYRLALLLTGRRRRRIQLAAWAGGLAMAGAVVGPMAATLSDVAFGSVLAARGPLALTYIAYLCVMVVLVIHEFWQGYRAARTPVEQRRHLLMLGAIAVAGLSLVDFFVPKEATLPSGVAPLVVIVALAIMVLAGTRYRIFSMSAQFGTDEVLRAMGDAVLVCDGHGIIRVANVKAQHLLGAGEGVLLGTPVERWLSCSVPTRPASTIGSCSCSPRMGRPSRSVYPSSR